ncbi:MAG: 16S rRNA (uracil(1498)-N(3))-methyltransferase [Thermodesulfobacteriota bacterium]|nr:16S rRNA (uracil(1498)-N(3))-methyltransferase [Thermodesulfobacteriota bacterium]
MSIARFLISSDTLSRTRSTLTLTGREAHHLTHVRRLGPGSLIELIDGFGAVAKAKIIRVNRTGVDLHIVEVSEQQNDCLPINLIVALLKGDRMAWMIQKATEFGVQTIYPVITQHTVVKVDIEKTGRHLVRWEEIAGQALKQCKGSLVPTICPVVSLEKALEKVSYAGAKILLWESEKKRSLFSAWRDQGNNIPVVVIVGPEGGFSREEILACQGAGFSTATMGRRTLRSETAAIGAVAALAAMIQSGRVAVKRAL